MLTASLASVNLQTRIRDREQGASVYLDAVNTNPTAKNRRIACDKDFGQLDLSSPAGWRDFSHPPAQRVPDGHRDGELDGESRPDGERGNGLHLAIHVW